MSKVPIVAAAAALALTLNVPVSLAIGPEQGGQQQTAATEGTKVTGTVMKVNEDKEEITIDDQTYVMAEKHVAMMPQVGAKVTIFYEEKDGKKTITSIGQAEK
jgi:hypothetical protein